MEPKVVILIVEDEPLIRMAGVAMLEEAGYEAVEAENADEAIALLESRNDVRLLFTDIDMPRGSHNGLKLAAAVYARWPLISIIVVSGNQSPGEHEMPAGSMFYAKPYPEAAVVAKVHSLLRAA